ncbi:MAG: hypothetical protein GEV10_04540 [Streptosporangiales bacterium]|nr:hypothetical protein [Streptosporangiales bacterium]
MISGFVVLFALAAIAVVVAWRRRDRLATLPTVLRAAMSRHLVVRVVVVLAWAWLGWHFLARTG